MSSEDAGEGSGAIAWRWWRALADREHGDRAVMARLRRCTRPADALAIPQAIALVRQLGAHRPEDALGLAILLAHVREDDREHRLMRAAGWKRFPGQRQESAAGEDRPLLSELRFRRLLRTAWNDRLPAFIRLVRLLGDKAKVSDLAESFLYWGDPVRQRWAFDYFHARPSTPEEGPSEPGAAA